MTYTQYYNQLTAKEKKELAVKLDTSVAYLSQLATGHRKAGAKYLLRIEAVTNGVLKPTDLRAA